MNRRKAVVAGHFLLNALSGRLGVPMMVMAYVSFAIVLLGYVSTQVYTHSLMEDVAARKRSELALRERIGVLTARYATATSKARVSVTCEEDLGLVESTSADVVRLAVRGADLPETPRDREVRVDDVLGSDMSGLSQVMRK